MKIDVNANNSTVRKAWEKIDTHLDSSEFLKFFVIFLDMLGNNQILHNKLGQKLLDSVKLWIVKMTFLVICSSGLHLDALLLSSNSCHQGLYV